MTRRIKLLQLHPDYNIKRHDFADLAEQIIKALPKDRFEVVTAFLRGHPEPGQPVSQADRSVYFDFSDDQLKGFRLRALWRLYRFCREEQFDGFIGNRFKPVNMMMQLNRWLKIPLCIGISHGFGEYDRVYRRRQARRSIDRHWRFVGVSPAVRQYLLDCRCGFTEANTVAITNAIDIAQAEALQRPRTEARQALDLPRDALIIGTVGRLVRVKGHTYLLQAFARLKARYPSIHLAIIGQGRESGPLRAEAEKLGVSDSVHLPGFREDALQYIKAFDIWTMPSLAEGLGLALLEGMCGHLPVIASDVPAMLPLIQGAGGIAVPPADVDRLEAAIESYLQLTDEQRREKGEQAYRYLIEHHDIDSFRQAYRQLIERSLVENGVKR